MLNSLAVYAVILNWNLAVDTIECIRSLQSAGLDLERVILVDNGSSDGSLALFTQTFSHHINYVPLSDNRGFAGGTNAGIRYALQAGAEWVLLINNDTYVDRSFFDELTRAIQARPLWKIISPTILYAGMPDIIWSMGDRRIGRSLLTRPLLRDRRLPDDLPAFITVDSLNACAMVVHRDVFVQVGGFDESYFMYAEDADFCWRAHRTGFRMGIATRARMWHKVSSSTGVYHPKSRYWRVRNQIHFYRKSAGAVQLWFILWFTILRMVLLTGSDLNSGRLALARLTWRAWFDGWFGH